MQGFIVVNAFYRSEEYLYQAERLREEFSLRGVSTEIIPADRLFVTIENGEIVSRLSGYDFCVFWDKDKYLSSLLTKTGLRLFNPAASIEICDDKTSTYIELTGHGIPMPKTIPGLLCFNDNEHIPSSTPERAETLGYPLIIKECRSSLGQGVYLVKNREELLSVADEVKCKPYLFQEYVESSCGKDVRVIVVGKDPVGAMLRTGQKDFRSNVCSGGNAEVYPLTKELIDLSKKIASVLKLDYCGIDFLFGKDGPVVCEVNSNAFFRAFERVTGINVAKKYVDHVLQTIGK